MHKSRLNPDQISAQPTSTPKRGKKGDIPLRRQRSVHPSSSRPLEDADGYQSVLEPSTDPPSVDS